MTFLTNVHFKGCQLLKTNLGTKLILFATFIPVGKEYLSSSCTFLESKENVCFPRHYSFLVAAACIFHFGWKPARIRGSEAMTDNLDKCNNVWIVVKNPFMSHEKIVPASFIDLYEKIKLLTVFSVKQKQFFSPPKRNIGQTVPVGKLFIIFLITN